MSGGQAGSERAFGQEIHKNIPAAASSNSLLKQANAVNGKDDAGGAVTSMDITLDGDVARQAAGRALSADNARLKSNVYTCDLIAAAKEDCHLYSVQYANRIMDRNFEVEEENLPDPDYMARVQQSGSIASSSQIHYKMRTILLNWVAEVHLKFRLRQPTLYLTVNIMDRFLSKVPIAQTKLQLVGCTSMWIACKYHEIYAPSIRDFTYISDKAFSSNDMAKMEETIVKTLDFKLTVPNPLSFLSRFNKVCEAVMGSRATRINHLSNYLLERCLLDYQMLKYKPSLLAASCIYMAVMLTVDKRSPEVWHDELRRATRCTKEAMKEPSTRIRYYVMANDTKLNNRHRTVNQKYSKPEYGQVAKLRPRKRS